MRHLQLYESAIEYINIDENLTVIKKYGAVTFKLYKNQYTNAKRFKLISGVGQILGTEYENNKKLRDIEVIMRYNKDFLRNSFHSVIVKILKDIDYEYDEDTLINGPRLREFQRKFMEKYFIEFKELMWKQISKIGDIVDILKYIKEKIEIDLETNKYNL